MTQNREPFPWCKASRKAVKYLALGRYSDSKIAAKIGMSRATITRWKRHPEFVEAVDRLINDYRHAVRWQGLAILERRIDRLNRRWDGMHKVIRERAASPEMQAVPGGTTGLLVRTVKGIGSGDAFQVVDEYAVDTGLLRELREHEKQAAQELGQWVDRSEVEQTTKAYVTVGPDDL
jgi:hypothetical protein